MEKPLTAAAIKHRKFARELVRNGGNGTRAYAKVYPLASKAAAANSASELIRKPDVQQEIQSYAAQIAELNGPAALARDLRSLRRAKKGVFFEGERVGTEPDNPTRLAATRTVLQVVGALTPDDAGAAAPVQVNIQINAAPPVA